MKKRFFSIILTGIFFIVSCAHGASSANEDSNPATIELPAIPESLREPSQRADYLIEHYWDNLDFRDTVKSHNEALIEQSFVDFLSVMPYASSEGVVEEGFSILLEKASADPQAYKMLTRMADDYLYDPNSPMLSEDLYLVFLNSLSNAHTTNYVQRERIADRIEMVSKNRTGTPAMDFTYETANGNQSSLRKSLPNAGAQLMLIFFDPECENCDETLKRIQENEKIMQDIASGSLKILAIYSGENKEAWKRKASTLPREWTVGININEIEDNDLYFFPAMPTIYLLDSDGIVIKKDLRV